MDVIDQSLLQNLESFVGLPLRQLRKYQKILTNLMEVMLQTLEEHREDIPVEITRYVANVQVELEHFERLVNDTYKIHSKRSVSVSFHNFLRLELYQKMFNF